jgi:hypothetical protein
MKKTRSERISDTVFFKHKYITHLTVTPADTIVKALDDLTNALKGRKNVKAEAQIEALEKIDELLNNIPNIWNRKNDRNNRSRSHSTKQQLHQRRTESQ